MKEKYKTPDFYLCCYLIAKGFFPEVIKEGTICYFLFERTEDLKTARDDYFSNSYVNVLDFKNSIRDLKSRISNLD